jgi:integrase/recombinase XerD
MAKRDKRRVVQPIGNIQDPRAFYPRLLEFLRWGAMQQRSVRTQSNNQHALMHFFHWCDERGLIYPHEVTLPILERYQHSLFTKRKNDGELLSVGSQRAYLQAIQVYYRWLSKQGYLLSNPAADLTLPKKPLPLPKDILSAAEVEQILAIPDIRKPLGLRDRAMLEVLYSTGLRRMELRLLTVHCINVAAGTLTIHQAKGGKARVVPISQRAVDWVMQYLEKTRPSLVTGINNTLLFLANDGLGFGEQGLSRIVQQYIKASGVRPLGSCHLFRHTMATLMLENGADTRWIQAILGHRDLSSTQIYTRVSIRALKEIHSATHPGASTENPDRAESIDDV